MDDGLAYQRFADLLPLSVDDIEDARFRGKDRAWATLAGIFDEIAESDDSCTYQALGDRVGLSRQQVQRWMDSPQNMTLTSLALLAEGLDADLAIDVCRRRKGVASNRCHPADEAKAQVPIKFFMQSSFKTVTTVKSIHVQSFKSTFTSTVTPSDE